MNPLIRIVIAAFYALPLLNSAISSSSHKSGLRTCTRDKSENLGIIANITVCTKCNKNLTDKTTGKPLPIHRCPTKFCAETESKYDELEGMFIMPDYVRCNSQESNQCFDRGITGELRFRLRKSCIIRNKAKRYDFTVHIKIPEKRALPVTKKTILKVHGLPENSTKGWMSPLGDELIFNINDVSWKDLQVFIKADHEERSTPSRDVIVRRSFSLAPLSQDKRGFLSQYFEPELNFARKDDAEAIHENQTAFFICKQDHVHENIVTEAFWQQKIFTGIVHKGHAHSATYKMVACLIGFILWCVMLCLLSALLTLKKQASIRREREEDKSEKIGSKDRLVSVQSLPESIPAEVQQMEKQRLD